MNVGVLGGTFDPIHNGHLMVAEEAKSQLKLTEVLFIPAGRPWLKEDSPVSPVEHRVQMVRLAIAASPHFKLSTIEIDRGGPSYTVDTIAELQTQLGFGDELFFIIGQDSVSQLPYWREPSRLIQLCRLVAVPRPGYALPNLSILDTLVPGLSKRLIVLDRPEVDISATEIRRRVAQGLPIDGLVPEAVEEYIKKHRLYRESRL